jgi:hypothetical protein
MSKTTPKQELHLPAAPKFSIALLGPGLVLIAMGLGSGEFILWPYFVAQFGFGILWGALVGVTLQYFVSNETGRYTLATGNSVFVGFYKLFKWFPYWFVISSFISFAWPGIIGTGGQILGKLLGIDDHRWLTVLMLIGIGLLLSFGGKVYQNLERVQKFFMLISMPVLIIIAALLVNPTILTELSKGLIGIGEGYILFPAGIALGNYLGAIAYAGAAGNLLLSHSFYIQDRDMGMAKYVDSQLQLGKHTPMSAHGEVFTLTKSNIAKFKDWFRVVALEQFITFWIIGIVSICLLTLIAYKLLYPFSSSESGINFVFVEAEKLSQLYSPVLGVFLLALGVLFLFRTQLGVFESTSRIMAENTQLVAHFFARRSRSNMFFMYLWIQIAFAITISLSNIAAPLEILFLNTLFSAVSMFVLSGAILWLNSSKQLPKEIQPSLIRKAILFISFVFFGVFTLIAILET